jgi:tetratricopeptide (TPR) repeat protein
MGGIGKTRLAVEYAWRHDGAFSAYLFVSANTPGDLETNFARLSNPSILNLPEYASGNQPDQYNAVLHWLQTNRGWFLIFDNVDTEPAIVAVQKLVPQLGGGQVLVTSRIAKWKSVHPLRLDLLEEDAAAEYLLDKTAGDRRSEPGDDLRARVIAHDLGYLALALEQAAAYINARHTTLAEYQKRWTTERNKLLAYHDPLDTDYPVSVAATLQTTFDQLTPNARRLLRILSWLAPEPIPRTLLEIEGGPFAASASTWKNDLNGPQQSPGEDAEQALIDLETYSLVTWSPDKRTFSVHGLLQEITRRNTPESEQDSSLATALRWVDSGFTGDPQDVRTWPTLIPLIPHARAVAQSADAHSIPKPTARLMNQLGIILRFRAQWAEAEPLMRRALAIDESSYGPDHPEVATDLNNLAQLLKATNRLAEAEPLMRRALAIDEKSYGPDHPEVAPRLNNLARLLHDTNRLDEAEPLMRRALAIDEKTHGANHPEVAIRLNNLAGLLQDTNRLDEAEPLYRRALAIWEDKLGPNHPIVTNALVNLARLLQDTRRPDEAEPLMRRALAIDESSYGPDHPEVATDLNNLAGLLFAANRLAEAEPLMRRSLEIREKSLVPGHPWTLQSIQGLALILDSQGKFSEAALLRQRLPEAQRLHSAPAQKMPAKQQ